jgi:hypothetical protein
MDLEDKMMEFIVAYNKSPKPLVWTKTTEIILEKIASAKMALI